MYKKILAIVLSSLMLSQSVSAAGLFDFVEEHIPAAAKTEEGLFDYALFRTNFPLHGTEVLVEEDTKKITTTAEVLVAANGSGRYLDSVTSNSSRFSFKVTLDTSNIQKAFSELYSNTINYIELMADESDKEGLKQSFGESFVEGNFVVTAQVENGLSGINAEDIVLEQEGSDASRTFVLGEVNDDDPNMITFNFSVVDGVTINDLYTDISRLNVH